MIKPKTLQSSFFLPLKQGIDFVPKTANTSNGKIVVPWTAWQAFSMMFDCPTPRYAVEDHATRLG